MVNDGNRGYCRVRENRGGKFYSLVYGRPCVMNVDPIEKKPFFHVYPGSKTFSIATAGCNLTCKFCQNWDISQVPPENVQAYSLTPSDIAGKAVDAKVRTVAYTYSEPIVFSEYVADCAKASKDRGIGNVAVSAGYIQSEPLKTLLPFLTAIKVDLKAFTDSFYQEICGGRLQPILDTLKTIREFEIWFEIVVLLIPTLNDADDDIKRLANWVTSNLGQNIPVHFTRYHPTYKIKNIPPTPTETLKRARKIAMKEGCHYVYTGNIPGDTWEDTYCHSCKALLIDRYGFTILTNNIMNGKCKVCGTDIPGVWV